jgi:Protein of unknown function (DUF2892)
MATVVVQCKSSSCHSSRRLTMKLNVGGIDRVLRIVVGLALIAWALLGGPVWAWIGVVPLATGLFSFCPLYTMLGMNTCPANKNT